jgi:O-antigen/teichoic acid export membrane protein
MNLLDKIKKNKVMKAGIGYTVGNYLLKGINFLTIPIFSRLMSTYDYGMYNTYIAYDSFICIFIALALHTSLKSAKLEFKEKFTDYVSSILIIPVAILGMLLIIVNIFFPLIRNLMDFNRVVLNLLLCHSFSSAVIAIYNNKIGLDYKYKEFLKISLVNSVSNLCLSIALMFTIFENERYMGKIIGSALPFIAIAIFLYIVCFKTSKPRYNKTYWKFGLSYSIPIIPHGISQVLLSQFDRLMIKSIIGASEAGIYSFAYNITQIVIVLTTSVDTVWGPWFFEAMASGNYKKIKKNSLMYIYGMFCIIITIVYVSPEVVKVMGSRSYWDGQYVTIPLLMSTFFTFLYTIPAQVEYYYKKTYFISIATMVAAGLNVVLNLYFIPKNGYTAAAYTTLVSYIAYFIFHYCMAKRIAKRQLFDTTKIVIITVAFCILGLVGVMLVEKILIRYIMIIVFAFINGFFIYRKRKIFNEN